MNVNNLGMYDSYQIKMFLLVLESIIRNTDSGYFKLNDRIYHIELLEVDKKGNKVYNSNSETR